MKNDIHTYSDAELFQRLPDESRREAAFKELYRRYEQRVWAYCRISLRNDERAKDLVQDAFYRFYKVGESGTTVENIPAYLMRIVRNLCLDEQRKESRHFVSIEEVEIPARTEGYEQQEMTQIVETALQLLPDEYKEALVLQAFSDMSYNEIADVQKVPLSTVRNRVVRAKAKLRQILSVYVNAEDMP